MRMPSSHGTTSACAENTRHKSRVSISNWNYLRVRGEYTTHHLAPTLYLLRPTGTTSACAENTTSTSTCRQATRNYLRVRGEYAGGLGIAGGIGELPPRARRIRIHAVQLGDVDGTTSACAENTAISFSFLTESGNYLRVRGEYAAFSLSRVWRLELPPRARRIQLPILGVDSPPGTTSACAENTLLATDTADNARNYLRVRGEYLIPDPWISLLLELPPRARRIQPRMLGIVLAGGTTSACAENTLP